MAQRTRLPQRPVMLPVTQKGQVTIPAPFRHLLGITAPGEVKIFLGEDGDVHLRAAEPIETLRGTFKPLPGSEHLGMEQLIEESLADQADAILRDMGD